MSLSLRRLTSLLSRSDPAEDDGPAEDTDDDWPYVWTEESVEKVHGEPVISHAAEDDPEDVFAGPLARSMVEGPRENPDQPLYIGLGTRRGRHVGIERQFLFRHTCVFGVTGYGKSTMLKNAAKQVIEGGHGACFIDPKGQDSIELMQILPDDRLDDVVWIEPGQARSAVAGFNFLEVGVGEDDPMYDTAVENVVGDLRRMIGADDYWGPLMDGVCSNLIRGTTRLDADFNLLDLYYILTDEDARARYAGMLEEAGLPWLADYAHKIEEMDDDDLDALQRRFKEWVEDPLARSTVAHRDSGIDVESIVEDGKILVVRMAEQDEDLKQMIGTAILRRIWSSVRSRAATYDTEYDPFYLFADEVDLIASQDSSVTTMLSKARSLSLALFLCCQQPSQLPDEVVSAMYSNCDTCLSFSPGSPENARAIAKNLDMDPATLRNESNYHVWTQITLSSTRERSEAFRTYTLPPFPPVRSVPEAMHAIERTVRDLGREPLSDEEMRRGLILSGESPDTGLMAGETLGDSDAVALAAAQGVYAAACRRGAPTGAVPLTECADGVRARVARLEETPDDVAETLAEPDDVFKRVLQDAGGVSMTADGPRVADPQAALANVGTDESAGGWDHARVLLDALPLLARAGIDVTVRQASGTDPDAVGRPAPEDEQERPAVVETLTGGGEARVEVASSTTSKLGSEVKHVLQAANEGRRCITLVRPDRAQRVAQALLSDPALYREHVKADGTRYRRAYTLNDYTVEGERPTRPGATRNVWLQDESTGEVVLRDTDSTEHARFEGPGAVFSDLAPYPQGGGNTVTEPVLPEYLLDDGAEPGASVVAVPERAETLGDLELLADGDGTRVSLDVVGAAEDRYPTESDESATGGVTPTDDLDVTDGARDLLDLLRDHGEPVTKEQADDLDTERDDGPDVARSTIARYVNNLVDEGALTEAGTTETDAVLYAPA